MRQKHRINRKINKKAKKQIKKKTLEDEENLAMIPGRCLYGDWEDVSKRLPIRHISIPVNDSNQSRKIN